MLSLPISPPNRYGTLALSDESTAAVDPFEAMRTSQPKNT